MLVKIAEYICCDPDPNDSVLESGWADEDDLILCLDEIEEECGFELSDAQLMSIFEGQMKVAELNEICIGMSKEAKISTQKERAAAREYRLRNKATLARKAKKRAKLTKAGLHRPKQRAGTASGGYIFIQRSDVGPKVNSSASTATGGSAGLRQYNFNPTKNTATTLTHSTLQKVANAGEPIENNENPIAGKMGYPSPPRRGSQLKPPKPGDPKPLPKIKSALTHNSLPQNKINRKPAFNERHH